MEQEGKRRRAPGALGQLLGRYKYVLLVVLAGVVCLCWPAGGGEDGETAAGGEESAALREEAGESLARELEEILANVQGVGRVRVLLTVDRGPEAVLAEDSSLTYSGQTTAPDDYSRASETVVVSRGGGEDEVVVRQEICPLYRGALVVCEGGGDPAVQLSVIGAVSALTGLGADKIAVARWQA